MSTERVVSATVNGKPVRKTVPARLLLADFLRDDLGLIGTHLGCEHGVCGVCTVLVDGEPVRSCLMLAAQVRDRDITTVEGIAQNGHLHPIQQAFWDAHALQCGYCTPGFLTTLHGLLTANPDVADDELRDALDGVLCRCTGYQNILVAAQNARDAMRAERG